jgi:N-acetyl-anhydromuramyl-L-alanine amidase AmpD
MSNSSLVNEFIQAHSSNYQEGRSVKINKIVIHHAATTSLHGLDNWVTTQHPKEYGPSASHYGVSETEIHQYVDESNTAYHARGGDMGSVAIEAVNSEGQVNSNDDDPRSWLVSEITFSNLVKLVADIAKRNNLGTLKVGKNLYGHKDFDATFCPGKLYPRLREIAEKANAMNKGTPGFSGWEMSYLFP